MEELILKYLNLSNSFRKKYKDSINFNPTKDVRINIPTPLNSIYSLADGTKYEVENQSLMDFIPGFLLIHTTEYNEFVNKLNTILNEKDKNKFYPILVNYSSDFYALNKGDLGIYLINHDNNKPIKIHNTFDDFIITLIACYEDNVYFLDEDGYLDMDFDKEELVAQKLNPDIKFWFEE